MKTATKTAAATAAPAATTPATAAPGSLAALVLTTVSGAPKAPVIYAPLTKFVIGNRKSVTRGALLEFVNAAAARETFTREEMLAATCALTTEPRFIKRHFYWCVSHGIFVAA